MSATLPSPVDNITKENLMIGMPFIQFTPEGGTPRWLGIVDSNALQKVLETITLPNRQSGFEVTEREDVSKLELSLAIGIFNFEPENLRMFLGSATLDAQAVNPAVVVADEAFTVPTDITEFGALKKTHVAEPLTAITPQEVTAEAVGTGDGTSGDTSGDFSLTTPVKAVADVTSVTVAGVAYTAIAVGAAAAGNEVAVVITVGATNGDLQFFEGGIAANVTGAIVATYTPSFAIGDFTLNTDYTMDLLNGNVRFLDTDLVVGGQLLALSYTYAQAASHTMSPFTQNSFVGSAIIRQATKLGINFEWEVPSVSIIITDDDFEWAADQFAVGMLKMNILSDGSAAPFGTWETYPDAS
jgi:hypothetical protein